VSNRRGLSRGDKRRNARLSRLREVVRLDHAVLAVDLASTKQVCVLTDHVSRVLARRTVWCRPWGLVEVIEWGRREAVGAGYVGVTVSCEPTGHRWKVVAELADRAAVSLVCVQPLAVARARESEDYTRDKSDAKDALVIARLTTQLRVYLPERQDPTYARLRHLGALRMQYLTARGAARQRLRDLLECAWPAALEAAAKPLDSMTWLAAMDVAGCDPARIRALGRARFGRAVAARLPAWGATRACRRIIDAVYAATRDSRGVPAQRPAGLERAAYALTDLADARTQMDRVEASLVAVLDQLDLTGLVTSIAGLSAVGAATILAETGDLTRFDSARAVVKHAGLCPRENSSGNYTGKTTISGRGRPTLRLAAWRAVWGAVHANPVLAARYQHLTSREHNKLTDHQARVAIAGSLLRQLHAVVTTGTPWNPTTAAGSHRRTEVSAA